MEKQDKKQKAKKAKKDAYESGPSIGAFEGTGANLFGYLSQVYGATGECKQKGVRNIYETEESVVQLQAMDPQLKLIFKKVQKKDGETKIKGLTELKTELEGKSIEELNEMAGYYIYIYSKLMATVNNRKIRVLANTILGVFITKTKKSLGAHIGKLMPFWYMALNDPAPDVVSVAKDNYAACFPKDRQAKVLQMCYQSLFDLVAEYLMSPKESILEDFGSMSEADKEDVYERVISSALEAVSNLFSLAATEPELKKKYVEGVISMLKLEEVESPLLRFLSGKFRSRIRAASLELIVALIENVEGTLLKSHEAKLSEFVLYSVGENNMLIQNILWSQALIKFIKACEDCWKYVNLKKAFFNRLYLCLRKAAFGAAPALYKNFVVFLSLCPFLKLDPVAQITSNFEFPEQKFSKPKDKKVEDEDKLDEEEETVTKQKKDSKKKKEDKKDSTKKSTEEKKEEAKEKGKSEKQKEKKKKTKDKKKEDKSAGDVKEENKDSIDSEKKKNKLERKEELSLAEQLILIKFIHDNLLEAIYNDDTAIHAEFLVNSYFDCCLFTMWKRLLPFWTATVHEESKVAVLMTCTKLLEKVIEVFTTNKTIQQRIYEILEKGFGTLFNSMRERNLPEEFTGALEVYVSKRMSEVFIEGKYAVGKIQMNLLHSLCSKVAHAKFSEQLAKLVLDYHAVIRKQIVEDISKQKAVQCIIDKFHLYCLFTYKFLCVTDKPLLSPAYMNSSESLPECEWLINLLSVVNSNIEVIQYSLLSVSAVFGSTGVTYQSSFDKLLSLQTIKNVEGAQLLKKYTINPISVTWELELKFMNKEYKHEKQHTKEQKGRLAGLVQLMNNSTIWDEVLKNKLTEMLDCKKGKTNMDTYKKLYLELASYFIHNEGKVNLKVEVITQLIKQIEAETNTCQDKSKFALVEEILISFIGVFLNSQSLAKYEKSLSEVLDRFYKGILSVLYSALAYYDKEILQSQLWDLVTKLLSSEQSATYYSHYVLVVQELTKNFLSAPKEEIEITKYIQFFRAFLSVVQNKDRTEIQILRDVLLSNAEITSMTSKELFADLSKLRIFTELFLRGGVGSDVPALLMVKAEDFPYIDLTCEILKALHLPCTSKTISIRNQITLYCDIELIPFLVSPHTPIAENIKMEFLLALVKKLEENAIARGSVYSFALEHLLGKLMEAEKESRSLLPESIYESFFNELVPKKVDSIVSQTKAENERSYSLVVHFLRCVNKPLIHCESYIEFIKKLKERIDELSKKEEESEIEKLMSLLGVYSAVINEAEAEDMEFVKIVLAKVIAKLPILDVTLKRKAVLYIAQLLHYSIKQGIDKLLAETHIDAKDLVAVVFQALQACEKEHEIVPELMLALCDIISLFAVFQNSFPSVNMEMLIKRLIEFTYLKGQEYKLRIEAVPVVIYELEYEMFEALGKLLERCVKFVTSKLSEELLYSLIGSNIESIQKAGYRMLKRMYIEFLPDLLYPVSEKWEPESMNVEGEEVKTGNSRYEGLNKNIPLVFIETLEKVPSLSGSYHDVLKETKKTVADVETIIENVEEEEKEDETPILYSEIYGYLLCWNIILDKVYYGWLHSRKSKNEDYVSVLNSISVYLNENKSVYEMFLIYLAAYLPTSNSFCASIKKEDLTGFDPASISLINTKDVNKFALYCLFNFMKNYPSLARNFYNECDNTIKKLIANVVAKVVGPTIWYAESTSLHNCQDILKENQLEVTMMYATREILASITRDDVEFSVSLKFPLNYPLKSIEVTNMKSGVFSEFEVKTWSLSMTRLISSQNCDLLGALILWKANYDKKFEGVEPCPICYSIVHEDSYSIPTLQCKTCKNKFHAACLKKWFRTSHKNKCPFCQNYFF